jgi:PhzF family phenazine biosynthesis protein
MKIHALHCFGRPGGQGNPALVIEDDASPVEARQALARERDTTCVWIDPSPQDGVAGVVDFYYPHTRSPLCLHATLAAARVLFARDPGAAALLVTTAQRGQALGLSRIKDEVFVQLEPQEPVQPDLPQGLLARLLDAPGFTPAAAPRVASVGSPKLLVQVDGPATLHGLAPDLAAITTWGKEAGVNGLYVYCARPDGSYEGRNFNHLDPRLEDSATGVAAGALSVLLGQGLTLLQGRATGRDCLIRTRVEGGKVFVGGRADLARDG